MCKETTFHFRCDGVLWFLLLFLLLFDCLISRGQTLKERLMTQAGFPSLSKVVTSQNAITIIYIYYTLWKWALWINQIVVSTFWRCLVKTWLLPRHSFPERLTLGRLSITLVYILFGFPSSWTPVNYVPSMPMIWPMMPWRPLSFALECRPPAALLTYVC